MSELSELNWSKYSIAEIDRRATWIAENVTDPEQLRYEIYDAMMAMRNAANHRIAELEAANVRQLARRSEWEPVGEGEVIPLRWGGEILQTASGEMTIKNARGGRNIVQLPDDVRICRRTVSEGATDE